MESYDLIGNNYNKTRIADVRIVNQILSLLECNSNTIIADIGAGTGNYSYELAVRNNIVYAIEPSELMMKQRKIHENIKWIKGSAELIPLKDESVDSVICTLATHHFQSINTFICESKRILKKNGILLIFTFDPRLLSNNDWLKDYFIEFHKKALNSIPSQESMIKMINDEFNTTPKVSYFKLPHDLTDSFFYSGWKYPEKYLDNDFRSGISVFALSNKNEVESAINKLKNDLHNGIWDQKYGQIRKQNEYSADYYFLSATKSTSNDI
jgi:ubiquinone/menaquinone biosynthesis C-methylase UbiE